MVNTIPRVVENIVKHIKTVVSDSFQLQFAEDYDCCSMAGHAAGAVLRVDATNRALPAGGCWA